MSNALTKLFEPYQLNSSLSLPNRIIMAPMTRNMAADDLSPTNAMVDYYARRADAGLIITEGTIIGPDSIGYSNVPGIYTDAQIKAWQSVTQRVHLQQGKIFSQIWHVGRISHPYFLKGALPIAPSDTVISGRIHRTEGLEYGRSRAATINEIEKIIESFAQAAKNAMAAGFDGIEIHGANGYLIDQFLHHSSNLRDDCYGGAPENMARFALEVVKACIDSVGADRVGLRLSPGGYMNHITDDNRDADTFKYLLAELDTLNIAYVHTGNFNDKDTFAALAGLTMTQFLRQYYKGTLIACGGYDFAEANEHIEKRDFDLIAIGRPFIANPDLISRLKAQKKLAKYHQDLLLTLE